MNKAIKISVIIPTHNSGKFITNTLDSVYAQTVLPYEIVVCDDGSKDQTVRIIERYFESHEDKVNRTKVLRQENKGAGAARNQAIRNTTGDWISFLDSDDPWMPDKLEKVIQAIRNHEGVNIIAHEEYGVYEGNESSRKLSGYHKVYHEDEDLYLQLFDQNFFSTSCMTVKKELVVKAGYMDEALRSAQDYDLWLRISPGQRAYIIKEPLAYYVMRENNITSNTYRRYVCECMIIEKNQEEIIRRLGIKKGRRLIKQKKIRIHLSEGYIALKRKQLKSAVKIGMRLIPTLVKG